MVLLSLIVFILLAKDTKGPEEKNFLKLNPHS